MKDREDVYPEVDVKTLCLDYILYDNPTHEELCAFFARGEFHGEQYLVIAMEKHLLTEDQRKRMFDIKMTIEKMMNGRYGVVEEPVVRAIYAEWNEALEHVQFGG